MLLTRHEKYFPTAVIRAVRRYWPGQWCGDSTDRCLVEPRAFSWPRCLQHHYSIYMFYVSVRELIRMTTLGQFVHGLISSGTSMIQQQYVAAIGCSACGVEMTNIMWADRVLGRNIGMSFIMAVWIEMTKMCVVEQNKTRDACKAITIASYLTDHSIYVRLTSKWSIILLLLLFYLFFIYFLFIFFIVLGTLIPEG